MGFKSKAFMGSAALLLGLLASFQNCSGFGNQPSSTNNSSGISIIASTGAPLTGPALARAPLYLDASSHAVIMEYEAWFGPGAVAPSTSYHPLLSSTDMNGNGYDSLDSAVLDQHVAWLSQLGVDAIIAEQTNAGPCDFGDDATCLQMTVRQRLAANLPTNVSAAELTAYRNSIHAINTRTSNLYSAFHSRGTSIKLIPMVDGQDQEMFATQADGMTPFDHQIQQFYTLMGQYPELGVVYEGKPMMLIYVAVNAATSYSRAMAAAQKWSDRLNFRVMDGFEDSQPGLWTATPGRSGLHEVSYPGLWSWINRYNPSANILPTYQLKENRVEAFTVTGAAPSTSAAFWAGADFSPWNGGNTLSRFFDRARELDPVFLIVNQFNEFAVPDQGADYEHSNDLEPTREWGTAKFDQAQSLLATYRQNFQAKDQVVTGIIDSAGPDGIKGWACEKFLGSSIQVQIFADGFAGLGGTYVGTVTANLTAEPAISSMCRTNLTALRFVVPMTADIVAKWAGHKVYAHGLSLTGGLSLGLVNSGQFTFPTTAAPAISNASCVITGGQGGALLSQNLAQQDCRAQCNALEGVHPLLKCVWQGQDITASLSMPTSSCGGTKATGSIVQLGAFVPPGGNSCGQLSGTANQCKSCSATWNCPSAAAGCSCTCD